MLTSSQSTVSLAIAGMTCGHCVSRVTRTLSGIPGIQVIDVSVGAAKVRVSDAAAVDRAIADLKDLGYTAEKAHPTAVAAPKAACPCCR